MLVRQDGIAFTTARAQYLDRAPAAAEQTQKIIVKITGEPLGGVVFAQLDTGAAWSVLDAEVAEAMSLLGGSGEPARISTRQGSFDGWLERTSLQILADDGESLTVEAPFGCLPSGEEGTSWGTVVSWNGFGSPLIRATTPSILAPCSGCG